VEPSERVTHLIARLDERFHERGNTCEVCNAYEKAAWVRETMHLEKMEVLVFVCNVCGNVRLHAARVLERISPNES
jgi:hypothetical protein